MTFHIIIFDYIIVIIILAVNKLNFFTFLDGFVIYGGKVPEEDGSVSNELWHYNVNKRMWTLRAKNSLFHLPRLTRHTLTLAGDYIYLFGGSTIDGEFSSRLYKIILNLSEFIKAEKCLKEYIF